MADILAGTPEQTSDQLYDRDLSEEMIVHVTGFESNNLYPIKHIDIGNDLHLIGGMKDDPTVWEMNFAPDGYQRKDSNYIPNKNDKAILAATMLKLIELSDQSSLFAEDSSRKLFKPRILEATDYGPIQNFMRKTLGGKSKEIVTFIGNDAKDPTKFNYRIDLDKLSSNAIVMSRLQEIVAHSAIDLFTYFYNRRTGKQETS